MEVTPVVVKNIVRRVERWQEQQPRSATRTEWRLRNVEGERRRMLIVDPRIRKGIVPGISEEINP